MKVFDWADLLHRHPIFSVLEDKELRWLLQEESSRERQVPAGIPIIHAGEVGDSIFLVGSGSAEAVLATDGDRPIQLALLRKGETFGEMAFFENRPRSAMVVAREPCVLLEIGGREFRRLLDEHPDIEVKLLLKVSERLRNANDQLLNSHMHGVDEKLQLFNDKLDVEHRIVEASMKAAQTVFDQTKLRADEVIQSADRSRTRLQVAASVTGVALTAAITLFGFLGYRELDSVRSASKEIRESVGTVKGMTDDVKSMTANVKATTATIKETQDQLRTSMELLDGLLRSRFREALGGASVGDAIGIYQQLRALRPGDVPLAEALYSDVEIEILRPSLGQHTDWSELLQAMRDGPQTEASARNEMWLNTLVLANALLNKPRDQVDPALKAFEAARGQGTGPDKDMLLRLKRFFDHQPDAEKRRIFAQAVSVASSP